MILTTRASEEHAGPEENHPDIRFPWDRSDPYLSRP